jgi:hypothetical protein
MRQFITWSTSAKLLMTFVVTLSLTSMLQAQQTSMSDFVIFGGAKSSGQTQPPAPGYAVQLGSSSLVQGGAVGSYGLVKSTGNLTVNGHIFSGGTIQLSNNNVITGRIAAANNPIVSGTILSVGSSANIGGNIDVNGNIVIGGGKVSGTVTHPSGTTYTGPFPRANIIGAPALPVLPKMPVITGFQPCPYPMQPDINSTRSITPGAYDDIKLKGNQTLTFNGPGIYVFDLVDNRGNNNFIFDFQNNTTGTFKIYIHNNASLDKISVSTKNGGSASRIYTEVHGTGSGFGKCAFDISNGSSSAACSKWLGTVWVPYAAINIGSGTGNANITGALWSGTQVNIQCGVNIIYAPFSECVTPDVNAGPDKALDFANQTILTGSSTTSGVAFSWQALNGGVITSAANTASITVSAAGTYILTAASSTNCVATDTVIVTGKNTDLIGSELQSVFQNFDPNAPPSPFFLIQHDSIFIDIITKEGQYNAALALLTTPAYGLTNILSNGASNFIITGLFPVSKLTSLNALPSLIVYVRPYYGAFKNNGIVTSAGDTAMHSDLVKNGFKLQGTGIKVGVISDSYNTILSATTTPVKTNTAAQDAAADDLPGIGNVAGNTTPVTVLKDYPFKSTDEGRAMLQIVHDVAPKADLYFRTGFISAGDFATGIQELKQAGCNIIVDDITYITEPFLKDGVIANAVDAVTSTGTTYFSAAGNFANKSYENTFRPVAAPFGLTGTAHDFSGSGDVLQNVTLAPGNYTIVLQWLDDIYSLGQTSAGGTKNDLDIYLTPDGKSLFGFNRNNTNGDPIEILPFTVSSTVNTNILITNNTTGSTPARFKYIVFQGDIVINEYNSGSSTIVGQANAAGAIAVGAARYDKAPPVLGSSAIVESFSSTGGTVINNVQRNKPDIVGPDGVNTTVNLGIDYDNNSYANFFGTSAAAPHAAGVAALIMEGKQKFSSQATTPADQIRSILQSTATNMYTPGFDFTSGYGFINADSAMRTFAKPTPALIQLVVPSNAITPGQAPFTLTVTGANLSPGSIIKFRDSTLATTVLNSGSATAVIPPFNGNPIISVYTPPVSISGLDGGSSDSLKFFNIAKKNITIIADNKTKKFGQQISDLTATILVNGDTLKNTTLTLADLGLADLSLVTSANAGSDIGTYVITPSRVFDPKNPLDAGFKELYNYTFTAGTLAIEKLPVTVTAVGATTTYGQKIPDIQFRYQFDGTGIPDSVALLNTIQSAHKNQLAKDDAGSDILGLVNGKAVTIVNGKAVPIVNGQDFNIATINGKAVTIVNGKAIPIVNGKAVTIVNGKAVTIVNNLTTSDTQGLSFLATLPALQNARTITNQSLVNGMYTPTGSTKVVDITQESILDYNDNSAQTYMLSAVPDASPKGLIDIESITNGKAVTIVNGDTSVEIVNGKAVTIVNGKAVTIVNGKAVTIVNGQAVTIVNGKAVTIVNGKAVPIVNSHNKTAVVVDSSEIGQLQNQLKSLNMITGLDAGDQFIIPGSLLNDNLAVTYVPGTIKIIPAPVIITPAAGQQKVFGADDPVFVFNNNAGLSVTDFTGKLSRATGSDAGVYNYALGDLSAGPNYNLSLSAGTPIPLFAIISKLVTITPVAGQSKIYGDADPVFTFTNSESLTNFTGALGRNSGNNVGVYPYTLGNLSAGVNYNLVLSAVAPVAAFAINKAPLQVKADDKVICKGAGLPIFTSVITGLKNGDKPAVAYSLSPSCVGASGVYSIVPSLVNFANAGNYQITYTSGKLYINPKGYGIDDVDVYLDCVEDLGSNYLPANRRYIAHFYAKNINNTAVYVAAGTDNKLSSSGSFDGSQLPVVFLPGTTRCNVPFDGNLLKWQLITYEGNNRVTESVSASSSSKKCISYVSGRTMAADSTATVISGKISVSPVTITGNATVFPNPVINKAIINFSADLIDAKALVLFDSYGRRHAIRASRQISQHAVEIDLSGLVSGVYFIRLQGKNGYKNINIVKE